MATKNKFKCPFCGKVYLTKPTLYKHLETEHGDQLDGLTPAHYYFNFRNKKTGGSCIICGKPTKFNEKTEKYDRIDSQRCREVYRQEFKDRMKRKYGKTTLLRDPEQQKKMLESRKISGLYTWSDGEKVGYTGTYEKKALEFLDKFLKLKSTEVLSPSPIIIDYTYQDKKHFYIPDFYIIPYNLLIEVKGTNNHYQKREYARETIKDEAAKASSYNYVKIVDKNYDPLLAEIERLKTQTD